jgi:endogenous inhibitor of DNA gyrase (YacG/DUF329 family)
MNATRGVRISARGDTRALKSVTRGELHGRISGPARHSFHESFFRMGIKIVACPRCGCPVEWTPASKFRPFCSERCKTRDLGAWAAEEYRIESELPDEETELPTLDRTDT